VRDRASRRLDAHRPRQGWHPVDAVGAGHFLLRFALLFLGSVHCANALLSMGVYIAIEKVTVCCTCCVPCYYCKILLLRYISILFLREYIILLTIYSIVCFY
jgi:hypothetical protein